MLPLDVWWGITPIGGYRRARCAPWP